MTQNTLAFDRLTFQLSNSKEQLENLSGVALSTFFCNSFGSFLVDLMFKLTLTLLMTLTLIRGATSDGYIYAYKSF